MVHVYANYKYIMRNPHIFLQEYSVELHVWLKGLRISMGVIPSTIMDQAKGSTRSDSLGVHPYN